MARLSDIAIFVGLAVCGSFLTRLPVRAADDLRPGEAAAKPADAAPEQDKPADQPATPPAGGFTGNLMVTVGKSITIDSPLNIQRIYYANGDLVEAVAINPKEVLITGKAPGVTTLMVWQQNGNRMMYELTVRPSPVRLDAVRQQIARDFPDDDINVTWDNDTAFVRGTVKDVNSADRVMAMVLTLGKAINLLRVRIPQAEPQILLKVKFADVDRSASQQLGINLASAALGQDTGITTGQFGTTQVDNNGTFTLSQALNVLLFRKDINLGATIQALESKNLLQMLSEPNLLAINGQEASFLSGGQFPVPMVEGNTTLGTVTIMFKEYGIRLTFTPNVTPRGTIRLKVTPEVSSLDFANGVQISGFTVPALSTRKVDTEVELESGQSFLIAGLLDNNATESFSKIPGLGDIPVLGKLFQSRAITKKNTELLVIVTPELVRPIPQGQPVTQLKMPMTFLKTNTGAPMEHPGMDKTGPVPVHPPADSMPLEQLLQEQMKGQQTTPHSNTQNPQGNPPIPQPPTAGAAGAPTGVIK